MEIAFQTKALRTVCLSGDAMDKRYGAEGGALLRERLADLRAAECLRDVPLLVLFPVPASLGDEIAMDVGTGLTIIFKANQQRPAKLRNGGIDWPRINRILIQRIEREHG
jgi:hypothetical protein